MSRPFSKGIQHLVDMMQNWGMLQQYVQKGVWERPAFRVILALGSRRVGRWEEVLFYHNGDGDYERVPGTVQAWLGMSEETACWRENKVQWWYRKLGGG